MTRLKVKHFCALFFLLSSFFLVSYLFLLNQSLKDFSLIQPRLGYQISAGMWDKNFEEDYQKFSRERLNLSSWGGFHEVALKEFVPIKELSLQYDLILKPNSFHLYYFDYSRKERKVGVRLSNNPFYPNIYFERDETGKFLIREELLTKTLESGRKKVAIHYGDTELEVKIDNKVILKSPIPNGLEEKAQPAWSGGTETFPSSIDNIKIKLKDSILFETGFGQFENFLRKGGYIFIFFLFIYFFISIKFLSEKTQNLIHINLGLAFLGVYFLLYYEISNKYFDDDYPDYDEEVYSGYEELKNKYQLTSLKSQDSKVYLYGGSKAYGDGSIYRDQTWFNFTLNSIQEDQTIQKYKLYNWAIPSADSKHFLKLHKELIDSNPKAVIIHAGINDFDPKVISKNIKELLEINEKNQIPTLIVEELSFANSYEEGKSSYPRLNYLALEPFCQKTLVTCLSTYDKFYDSKEKSYDLGILWMEWVHNSSYGQKVFAEITKDGIKKFLKGIP